MPKKDTLDHPKTIALADELDIDQCTAFGVVCAMIHHTALYAPDGALGRFGNKAIAIGMRTTLNANKVIDALLKTRWLDPVEGDPEVRFVVHDWEIHCENWVREKLEREGRTFYSGATPSRSRGRPPKNPPDEPPNSAARPPDGTPKNPPENGFKEREKPINKSNLQAEKIDLNSNKNGLKMDLKTSRAAHPIPSHPSEAKDSGSCYSGGATASLTGVFRKRNEPGGEVCGSLAVSADAMLRQVVEKANPNVERRTELGAAIPDPEPERDLPEPPRAKVFDLEAERLRLEDQRKKSQIEADLAECRERGITIRQLLDERAACPCQQDRPMSSPTISRLEDKR
ncbi:MAG TPA: hypothetical protein VG944_14625 [Fimbriimonas sp.]|nr:hypothetical protein [Fimbriimonas sp.]